MHDTLYVSRSKNTYYVCFDMFYVWRRITDEFAVVDNEIGIDGRESGGRPRI